MFDVTYDLPRRSIRVLATNEEDANHSAADHADFSWTVTPAKSRRRSVSLLDDSVVQHKFVRVLGRAPRLGSVIAQLAEPAMFETFGPPERIERPKSTLLFWNFAREDGNKNFTLFTRIHPKTKPEQLTINIAVERDFHFFYEWVLDRICAVDNGDEAPLFLGSGAFAVTRVGR